MTKSALIVHPYKPVLANGSNGYSQEMVALADYLYTIKGYSAIKLYTGGYVNLAIFDEIWLSCFSYRHETALLNRLSTWQGTINYICNDPDFFAISETVFPKTIWQDRIIAQFCGNDYKQALRILGKPAGDDWYAIQHVKLPLWQHQFKGLRSFKPGDAIDYNYQLGYAGNNRSVYRSERIAKLTGHNLQAAFVGWDAIKLANSTYYAKMPVQKTLPIMQKCLAQLVVGDESYLALMPAAHRLLQGLCLSPLVFIDAELAADWFEQDYLVASDAKQIEQTISRCISDKPFYHRLVAGCDELFARLTNKSLYAV